MTNKMVIGYKFAFILLLLSSCVEDIRNCDPRRQGTDGTPFGNTRGKTTGCPKHREWDGR